MSNDSGSFDSDEDEEGGNVNSMGERVNALKRPF
jgi:hypothetical protein